MSKQLLPLNIWMVDIVWLFLRWMSKCGSVIDGAWSRLYICNPDKCRQSYFWHLLIKKREENISHASVTAANSLSDWRLKQEGVWNACVYERYIAEESLSNFHTHICVADTIHMLQKHVRSAVKTSTAKRIMTEWNTMRTRAMSSWPVLKAENNPNVLVDNQVVTGRTLYKDHFSMYRVLGWMTLTDRRWRHFVTFSMLDLISPCFWGNFTPRSPLWATLIRLAWKSSEFWNCEEMFFSCLAGERYSDACENVLALISRDSPCADGCLCPLILAVCLKWEDGEYEVYVWTWGVLNTTQYCRIFDETVCKT